MCTKRGRSPTALPSTSPDTLAMHDRVGATHNALWPSRDHAPTVTAAPLTPPLAAAAFLMHSLTHSFTVSAALLPLAATASNDEKLN